METCFTCDQPIEIDLKSRHRLCKPLENQIRRESFSPREVLELAGVDIGSAHTGRDVCDKCIVLIRDLEKGLRKTEETLGELNTKFSGRIPTPDFKKRETLRKQSRAPQVPKSRKRLSFTSTGTSPQKKKTCQSPKKTTVKPLKTVARAPTEDKTQKSTPISRAIANLKHGNHLRGMRQLLLNSAGARNALVKILPELVRNELGKARSKRSPLTTKSGSVKEYKQFNWGKVVGFGQQECPLLTGALTGALTRKFGQANLTRGDKVVTSEIGNILAQVLFFLNRKMHNLVQKQNGVLLWLNGCKRAMFKNLNHLGICSSISTARKCLDQITVGFDHDAVKWKEALGGGSSRPRRNALPSNNNPAGNLGYVLCFDNVNHTQVSRYQTKGKEGNEEFNMVQAFSAQDRIPCMHLSDVEPGPNDIRQIPLAVMQPNPDDMGLLRWEQTIMIQRILVKHMTCFQPLQSEVVHNIPHQFSTQSARKSPMVPLGVLNKDENKSKEMIEILLDYHQKYIANKADGTPLKTVLFGDGLSIERAIHALIDRLTHLTAWERLEGVEPAAQEWHLRMHILEDAFKELWNSNSHHDVGTLVNLKTELDHSNASSDVKHNFAADSEFLQTVTEGYVILAAMDLMGLQDITDQPAEKVDIDFLMSVTEQISDLCFVPCDRPDPENVFDHKLEYSRGILFRGLFLMALRDAVRENDGDRMIAHWKFLMPHFFRRGHPKYFILGARLLLDIGGAVSERLAFQLKWSRTVNKTGGTGNNIACDLQMEHYNRDYKESIKSANGQLTEKTINRHSHMVGIREEISGIYDKVTATKPKCMRNRTLKSEVDVRHMVTLLQPEKLFTEVPGRCHASFEDYTLCTGVKDVHKLNQRLEKHRNKLAHRKRLNIN